MFTQSAFKYKKKFNLLITEYQNLQINTHNDPEEKLQKKIDFVKKKLTLLIIDETLWEAKLAYCLWLYEMIENKDSICKAIIDRGLIKNKHTSIQHPLEHKILKIHKAKFLSTYRYYFNENVRKIDKASLIIDAVIREAEKRFSELRQPILENFIKNHPEYPKFIMDNLLESLSDICRETIQDILKIPSAFSFEQEDRYEFHPEFVNNLKYYIEQIIQEYANADWLTESSTEASKKITNHHSDMIKEKESPFEIPERKEAKQKSNNDLNINDKKYEKEFIHWNEDDKKKRKEKYEDDPGAQNALISVGIVLGTGIGILIGTFAGIPFFGLGVAVTAPFFGFIGGCIGGFVGFAISKCCPTYKAKSVNKIVKEPQKQFDETERKEPSVKNDKKIQKTEILFIERPLDISDKNEKKNSPIKITSQSSTTNTLMAITHVDKSKLELNKLPENKDKQLAAPVPKFSNIIINHKINRPEKRKIDNDKQIKHPVKHILHRSMGTFISHMKHPVKTNKAMYRFISKHSSKLLVQHIEKDERKRIKQKTNL